MKKQSLLMALLVATCIGVIFSCQKEDKLITADQTTTDQTLSQNGITSEADLSVADREDEIGDPNELVLDEVQEGLECCQAKFIDFKSPDEFPRAIFQIVNPSNPGRRVITVERVRPVYNPSNFVHYSKVLGEGFCQSGKLMPRLDSYVQTAFQSCPDTYRIHVKFYTKFTKTSPWTLCAEASSPEFKGGSECIGSGE